jgi:hypothetical protein
MPSSETVIVTRFRFTKQSVDSITTLIVEFGGENLIAFESKLMTTCWTLISSISIAISYGNLVNLIEISWSLAYFLRISIASDTVALSGHCYKLGVNKPCSSMFLSRRSLTCDNSNFDVVIISLASYLFGESTSACTTVSAKLTMHFRGVTISWVTL